MAWQGVEPGTLITLLRSWLQQLSRPHIPIQSPYTCSPSNYSSYGGLGNTKSTSSLSKDNVLQDKKLLCPQIQSYD